MNKEEVTIPEDVQQICRDFAEVAIKHGLLSMSGKFSPRGSWGGEVSFGWTAGRHSEESNELSIVSQFYVHTKVKIPVK